MHIRPATIAIVTAFAGIVPGIVSNAARAAPPEAAPTLQLINGSSVAGTICGSGDPAVLLWRSPHFREPLEFPLGNIKAIHYPTGPALKPSGEYCFELSDGDILYGDLVSLTGREVELKSAPLGAVRIAREYVRRFYRWKGAETIYHGPNGLAGWSEGSTRKQWIDRGGRLYTDRRGASIFADLGIPEKAAIEIELSWKKKPDFILTLGVDERDRAGKKAYHFEVWDDDLVLVGETDRYADATVVQHAVKGEGSIRVKMYLDQRERRLILPARDGMPPATLTLGEAEPPFHTGVRLTNGKGDLLLEHLRVTRWNGLQPLDVRNDLARVHRTDGSIVYGLLTSYDPRTESFIIRDGMKDTTIRRDAIADVFFAPKRAGKEPDAAAASRIVCVSYRDGARLSGRPTRIEDGHISLACAGVQGTLRLPLADVRAVIALQPAAVAVPAAAGRTGRLELDGLNLSGRLATSDNRQSAPSLVWHTDSSRKPNTLAPGFSGRIVYKDSPPSPEAAPPQPPPAGVIGQVIAGVFGSGRAASRPAPAPSGRRMLHLRTGDTIPCEVQRIDEKGMTFKTPQSDATFVPHEKIKCVELIATSHAPELDESKRDRLLTLPRMQRDSPPTHLICSRNGDFLRGRIIEMDDARLKIEVRLETKDIPRDRVAQIIWLHADELADPKSAAAPSGSTKNTRVQAVSADGNRLTFVLGSSDGTVISGTSDVLGACRISVTDVDQLLFGTYIEQSAARLAYHVWKLRHAAEPKLARGDSGGSTNGDSTGAESPLVGKPAPAFQLDLLNAGKFKLADRKGRIVVLDFWATWCGPCIQSMPAVDGVVREFADRDVELVAINMEEQPDQVKAMLERHKLKMPVAIDRDGAVAAKYAVTAIPQTVVIDRDGNVARLFIGGGKGAAEALRTALQELVAGKAAPAGPR